MFSSVFFSNFLCLRYLFKICSINILWVAFNFHARYKSLVLFIAPIRTAAFHLHRLHQPLFKCRSQTSFHSVFFLLPLSLLSFSFSFVSLLLPLFLLWIASLHSFLTLSTLNLFFLIFFFIYKTGFAFILNLTSRNTQTWILPRPLPQICVWGPGEVAFPPALLSSTT